MSAKSTVRPTRSCDHLTCFSLGTFYRSPLGRVGHNHPKLAPTRAHLGTPVTAAAAADCTPARPRIITWRQSNIAVHLRIFRRLASGQAQPALRPGKIVNQCRVFRVFGPAGFAKYTARTAQLMDCRVGADEEREKAESARVRNAAGVAHYSRHDRIWRWRRRNHALAVDAVRSRLRGKACRQGPCGCGRLPARHSFYRDPGD